MVEVENILDAIRSLSYQHLYLNNISGLPLFFSHENNQYKLDLALTTPNNQKIIQYWQSQNNLQKIAGIFSNNRLNQILKDPRNDCQVTLYCFTHIARGKKYFYSATASELAKTGLADLFFSFGAVKDSWQVYQLSLCPITDYQWQLPDVLPKFLVKQEVISPQQQKHLLTLHGIKLMAYLVPISDSRFGDLYKSRSASNSDLSQLKQFGHRDTTQQGLSLINATFSPYRLTDRYSYQTKIFVHYDKQTYSGKTIDFSNEGMQIKLERSIECHHGETLTIQMPLLDRTSNNEQASHISYEIMRITDDEKIINLKITSSDKYINGPKNIYRLIQRNKTKLTSQVSPPLLLTKSLDLLYTKRMRSLPLIIAKEGKHYKISKIIEPCRDNRLFNLFHALSSNPEYGNVAAIAKSKLFLTLFEHPLKQMSNHSEPYCSEIYIQLIPDQEGKGYGYITQVAEELETSEQHLEFISQPGVFFAIQILVSRCDQIDYKTVSRELIYAAKQASYKTRNLQTELDAVVAVAELIDVTEEVKLRFNINTNAKVIQSPH